MATETREHLLYAFRRVLRPLVRLLLRAGVQYDTFVDLAKGVFVETAARDGLGDFKNPTRARISVTTGIPRREVDRFIDDPNALPQVKTTLASVLVEVLTRWHSDPTYSGPYGLPKELPFTAESGPSVVALVKLASETASPDDALRELLDSGAVKMNAEEQFRAVSRFFIPEAMSAAQIEYFGNAVTRLANTLQFNMDKRAENKRVERFVVADKGLAEDLVLDFEAFVRDRMNGALVEIDNWLSTNAPSEFHANQARVIDVGLNVFSYVEPKDLEMTFPTAEQ